jgi:hypothetical protein
MSHRDFINSALLQDEVLLDCILVIEHGWPAGPNFLYSLGSLIEASVIHERVYFDPLNYTKREDSDKNYLHAVLRDSPFVRSLAQNGALKLFPQPQEVNKILKEKDRDYRHIDFLSDAIYEGISFGSAQPSGEKLRYESLLDLFNIPEIFQENDLAENIGGQTLLVKNAAALRATQIGFNYRDLRLIGAMNRRALAFLDLARNMETNLYSSFTAIPHYVGAISQTNSKARELYMRLEKQLLETDEKVGATSFNRIPVAPLAQIILTRSQDSATSIADEICQLRHEHRGFRSYLTSFETEWTDSATRRERRKLQQEFDNAWATLIAKDQKPSSRLIYTLWDIVKSPLQIPKAVGEKLVEKGRELSVIGKARGRHDFWNALGDSPTPDRNRQLLVNLFPQQAEQGLWDLAARVSVGSNKLLQKVST